MKLRESRFLWAVVMLAAAFPLARGLWLDLQSPGTKCVSEELHRNVVVLADYYAFSGEDYDVNNTVTPMISVKVTSPYGNNLHHQEKVSHGQFSFTTTEGGNYLACFTAEAGHHDGKKVTIGIDWKTGIATKEWDEIARKDNIEGLELELRKLEDAVGAIQNNLYYLREREAEMRGVSETTNARVARLSIMSLGICIGVSVVHIWYLKRYFQKKKLI